MPPPLSEAGRNRRRAVLHVDQQRLYPSVFLSSVFFHAMFDTPRNPNIPDVMTFEEFLRESYAFPYTYDVNFKNSLLRYVGVEHSNVVGSDTIRHVKEVFHTTAADLVICECLPFSRHQAHREQDLDELGAMKEDEVIHSRSEIGYVAWLAKKEGVAVIGAEPEFEKEVRFLLQAGFSRETLFALYTFRVIPQWLRTGRSSTLEAYLRPFFSRLQETEIWSEGECTIENMRRIGESLWEGEELCDTSIEASSQRVDPSYKGTGIVPVTAVNHAHRQSILFRDRHIISEILWAVGNYRKVLCVYGGQHAVAEERTLRALAAEGDTTRCLREWSKASIEFARGEEHVPDMLG